MTDLIEVNCDCEDVSPYKTLAELRTDFMIGAGYAAQAANPPPGMAVLIRFWLNQAQDLLWLRYKEARGLRMFKWTMVPGLRFYGIDQSDDGTTDGSGLCALKLDPKKVNWVGFEDLNASWVQLFEGIPPEFYTRLQTTPGWPSRYEIRSCIEIFPAPQAAYTLWIKGVFDKTQIVADGDRTSMDDSAVLWMALGMFKKDADMKAAALQRIKDIVAGQHNTARFVPAPGLPLPPLTPPKFLPLNGGPP